MKGKGPLLWIQCLPQGGDHQKKQGGKTCMIIETIATSRGWIRRATLISRIFAPFTSKEDTSPLNCLDRFAKE